MKELNWTPDKGFDMPQLLILQKIDKDVIDLILPLVSKATLNKAFEKQIIDKNFGKKIVSALIMGNTGIHSPRIDLTTGNYYCSCVGFLCNRTVCSHLARLLFEIYIRNGREYLVELIDKINERLKIAKIKKAKGLNT